MTSKIRIIPRLDIKGPNLVKGIHLEGLRVLGKPKDFAEFYYQNGADELFFQDSVASLYERNSLGDIISETAKMSFIPLTVGGGIRTIQDINNVLRAGADKVAINTAAINNPEFVRNATLKFGSSTIVGSIEAIRENDGRYLAYTDNGREFTGVEVVEWAKKLQDLGVGEIVITSVDREGTGEGFDMELIKKLSEIEIPLIAHGGFSCPEDIVNVLENCSVDAFAIASSLHYDYIINNRKENSFKEEGNTTFLNSGKSYTKIKTCTIQQIKQRMKAVNIPVRI